MLTDVEDSSNWFVSADWLNENLNNPNIKIIDGTWTIPGSTAELPEAVIAGSFFADLGQWKAATKLGAPFHPKEVVGQTLSQTGVCPDNHIVVYDKQGYFSAPRIAWSLRAIGHDKVSVLRDGLPSWLANEYPTIYDHQSNSEPTNYITKLPLVSAVTLDNIEELIGTDIQIVDARPAERFAGITPEPRPGLRSGHIPGSINLPLNKVKNSKGKLLEDQFLVAAIETAGIDLNRPIVTTCGSGVTASALAWIFYDIGKHDVSVYSGSWAEYGASDKPIETS